MTSTVQARNDQYLRHIHDVVARHAMPDFVDGFDVELGDFDGDPAMWIIFRTTGEADLSDAETRDRVRQTNALTDAVEHALLGEIDDRYPYIYFRPS